MLSGPAVNLALVQMVSWEQKLQTKLLLFIQNCMKWKHLGGKVSGFSFWLIPEGVCHSSRIWKCAAEFIFWNLISKWEMLPALCCDKLRILMVSGWLWLSSHTYRKMHEFGFADGILGGGNRLSRSETISCVCMFSLSHTFTKDGRAVEKEKSLSWDHNLLPASVKSLWFQKASQSGAARITALHPQSQKHISWWRRGRVCLRMAPKPLLILPLNIYHRSENTPLHPVALLSRAWFMTRAPSASSDQRRVHHSLFWLASVLFKPEARRREEDEMDGKKRERTGESPDRPRELVSTYLYIKEVTLPCKFSEAHL